MNNAEALAQYFTRLVDYNVWANDRIADLCRTMDPALFEKHFEGSFPSIRSTLCHVWDAEFIWLSRLKGASLSKLPSKSKSIRQSMICEGFQQTSGDFKRFVFGLDETALTASIDYATTRGEAYSHGVEQVISHTMNHSTYHRGQIVLYARLLGIENVPSTDQILYFRLNQQDIP